jgi:hypothetical protein
MPDMIESEYLHGIVAEQTEIRMIGLFRRTIERALKARFGDVPDDIVRGLAGLNSDQLIALFIWANSCPDVETFREKLGLKSIDLPARSNVT